MKNLEGQDKLQKVLELQEQGMDLKSIAIEVEYSGNRPENGLGKFMNRRGYQIVDGKYQLVKEVEETTTKAPKVSGDTENKKSNTFDKETLEKLLKLADNFDNIMSITSSNTSNITNQVHKESIHNACKDAVGVSIKVDHEVWKKFKKYAKLSDYKQQDLLTVALEMLMKSNL